MASGVATVPRVGPRGLDLPRQDVLVKEIRAAIPGIKIYNPAPEWFMPEAGGITHWVPPDLGGAVVAHPRDNTPVVADGTYEIKDRYGRDLKGFEVACETAFQVVKFLCENYGNRGITWMSGNPEEDEKRKAASKKIYFNWQRNACEETLGRRREFMANWQKDPKTKDMTIPGPSDRELRAQETLDAMRINATERQRTYVCECGMWEGDDFRLWQQHRLASHGERVEKPKDEDVDPQGRRRASASVAVPDEGPKGQAAAVPDLIQDVVATSLGGQADEFEAAAQAGLAGAEDLGLAQAVANQRAAREAKKARSGG